MHRRAVASISRRIVATRASASMRVQHDAAVFAAASGLTSSSAFVLKPQTLIFETTNNNTATIASTLRTFGTTTTTNDAAAAKDYQAFLESLSPAEKKFLDVLLEYRKNNFEHSMPKRFLSMIIKAVDSNQDGVITMEEYQTLLINIGATEKMTAHDLDELFKTLGDDELDGKKVITVQSIEAAWAPFLNIVWKL